MIHPLAAKLAAAALGCLAFNTAYSQAYPAKPVKVIMTLGAGGGAEPAGRIIHQKLQEQMGQPFLLEAQGGAGGSIGAAMVARAAPDGYTLAFSTPSSLVLRKFLSKNIPYDTLRDFTPIVHLGETMASVSLAASFPANTLLEVIEYAKKHPGKIAYGSSGIGTTHHLSGVLIEQITGARMLHVPYKGGGDSVAGLLGGQIQLLFGVYGSVAPQVKAGKAKLLAINGGKRFHRLPDVPTVNELVKGYDRPPSWLGYLGPAHLPQPLVRRLYDEIHKAAYLPDVVAKLESVGILVDTQSPEEFAAYIRSNFDLAGRIMKLAKIEPE